LNSKFSFSFPKYVPSYFFFPPVPYGYISPYNLNVEKRKSAIVFILCSQQFRIKYALWCTRCWFNNYSILTSMLIAMVYHVFSTRGTGTSKLTLNIPPPSGSVHVLLHVASCATSSWVETMTQTLAFGSLPFVRP
jgi:hypothetical protein